MLKSCGLRQIVFVPAWETGTVARLGADEFTIILQDLTDTGAAEIVAGKIVRELARPFSVVKELIHISASIGVALSSRDVSAPEYDVYDQESPQPSSPD